MAIPRKPAVPLQTPAASADLLQILMFRSQSSLAAFAGLPFVKINPLELDLDVVTGALSAAFARRHGLVAIGKTGTTLTVAVHDPLAPFPLDDIKNVSGLAVERVVATRPTSTR